MRKNFASHAPTAFTCYWLKPCVRRDLAEEPWIRPYKQSDRGDKEGLMKQNIVLIGMMGCGKTTVGKRLSEQLNMPFIDTDVLIEETYGPIPKLFERGEDYFRDAESKIISEIASFEGAVISTGGGVVLREENVKALKEKGFLIFIDRPVHLIAESIDFKGRPLLSNGPEILHELMEKRYPYTRPTAITMLFLTMIYPVQSGPLLKS